MADGQETPSMQGNPSLEVPTEMRDFAERSLEQARKAMNGFMGTAMRAFDSFEGSAATVTNSAQDMRRKTLTYAEQNIQAAFEHAQKMVRVKDPAEAMRLQAEFVQSQVAAMQAQMKEFGGAIQGAAQTVMKPPV